MKFKTILIFSFGTVVYGLLPLMCVAQATPAGTTALGVWSSATLDEIASVGRPECQSIKLTQRTVTLKTAPDKVISGTWVRWTRRVWLNVDYECRWFPEESQFEPIQGAEWTYNIKGRSNDDRSQSFNIVGEYSTCLGNACNRWAHENGFETELKLVGNTLVDTNKTEDLHDDVEFMRFSDEEDLLEDARTTAEQLFKPLDLGQLDRFYDQATTSSFRSNISRDEFSKRVSEPQARLGLAVSRKYLLTTHVLYAPMVKTGRDDYVIFSNKVTRAGGTTFLESVCLARENGQWRVLWLF
jgi:hypothetical protein